jgi:hypothetical protein
MWLFAAINAVTLAVLLAGSHGGIDRNGFLLGTDFLSFWTAGRMLALGQPVYDTAAHIAAQQAHFAHPGAYTAFFYPPTFLPLCRPLGALPYLPALAGWLALTGAVFAVALRTWLRGCGVTVPWWLALIAFPPVVITITHGQTAFLAAGLLGLGLWLVRDRSWLGGALIGLATIKPQLGLLVPVALLASGQWRAVFGAVLGAAALGALATVLYGAEIWPGWLDASRAANDALAQGAVPYGKMVSAFAGLRLLGAGVAAAWAVQGVVAALVVVAVAAAAWRRPWHPGLAALVLAGVPLATPFVLDYDLLVLAFPLIWLAARAESTADKVTIGLGFALAGFARPAALGLSIPLTPPIAALLLWRVWRRCRSGVNQFGV